MAYKSSARGVRPVTLVAVHTAEGARTARNLGAYFYRDDVQASSHVGIDATETLQYVPYDRASWTLRSGNPISDNAELCAFAHWTRAQWLGTDTIDGCVNPRGILDATARWIRERCLARNIPIIKLSAADVAAGQSGVIGHVDWTYGMRDGTHVDPGTVFPWDYVITQANRKVNDMSWDELIEMPGGKKFKARDVLAYADYYAGEAFNIAKRTEAKVDALTSVLSDDEANIVSAVQAIEPGAGLTEEQYARIIADQLPNAVLAALITLAQERDQTS